MAQVTARPSRADVERLLKKHSALRAIRDARTGDLYVWNAEEALHEEVLRQLGLTELGENVGQILSIQDFDKLTK